MPEDAEVATTTRTNEDAFDYDRAFGRNLGLVSPEEQRRIRNTRVALVGLGGVGGWHAQALARLGVGTFHIADPDGFELHNIHRQCGADSRSLGQATTRVTGEVLRGINPTMDIQAFPDGLHAGNVERVLSGVDAVVDGLDFFAVETRRMLCREARRLEIPVINCGPVGLGAAVMVFHPAGMGFDEYLHLVDGMARADMLMALALGFSGGGLEKIDRRYMDLASRRAPALGAACVLCGALATFEFLKLVTGKGTLAVAPNGYRVDPLRGRIRPLKRPPDLVTSWRGRVLKRIMLRRFPQFAHV